MTISEYSDGGTPNQLSTLYVAVLAKQVPFALLQQLADLNITTDHFRTQKAFLQHLANHQTDCMILHVETVRQLQRVHTQITQSPGYDEQPILLLVNADDTELIEVALALGVTDCLIRPLQPTLLQRRIQQAMARQSQYNNTDESHFRTLYENLPEGTLILNPHTDDGQWQIVDCNPAFSQLVGYHPNELQGLPLSILQDPPMPDGELDAMLTFLQGVGIHQVESVRRHKDGTRIATETLRSLITIDSHEYVLELDRDITNRKQATTVLAESEHRFRTLFHSSPLSIALIDPGNKDTPWVIADCNRAFAELHGYATYVLIGNSLLMLHPNENVSILIQHLQRALQDDDTVRWDAVQTRADGQPIHIAYTFQRLALSDHTQILCIEHDVTTQKRVEHNLRLAVEQQQELIDLKTRFVSMVSHDFRSPLAIMSVKLQALEKYYEQLEPDQRTEQIQFIQTQIDHMIRLLEDVVMVNRTGEFRQLDVTPTDMQQLARDVAEEVLVATNHRNPITLETEGKPYPLLVDFSRIHQALTNILTNASKYSPEHAPITLGLQYTPEALLIRCEDQGIGIPDDDQEHLFDPFFRAKNARRIPGSGLGLSIVKQVTEQHNGTVTFQSEIGQGTRINLILPRV